MAHGVIHVVRHADAGDRDAWSLDDDLRPLSERGCGQAGRLAAQLGVRPAVIHSSPSLRCIATVLPMARAHGLPLSTLGELCEGGNSATMLERLRDEPPPVVACTHGDILDDLIGRLAADGIVSATLHAEKGSTLSLEVREGRVIAARYAPPP